MTRHFLTTGVLAFLVMGCHMNQEGSMEREVVKSPDAPAAIGPYSQAIKVGNTLYCSGQIPIDPATGELVNESVEAETRQVLENLSAIVTEAGFAMSDIVRCTVYMSDMEDYAKINKIYSEYFQADPPARVAVQVAALPKYVRVEISGIAVKTK
jgi:2-iminobutanoate/2-iminopropanoate deaminase